MVVVADAYLLLFFFFFFLQGVDILIDSDMNAHLIEVNFAPNCARLQSYHDFFGDLFELLFFQRNPRDIWTRLL